MLERNEWLNLARKLDWNFSYVTESEVFPEIISGQPWLEGSAWENWEEPYQTTFAEYVILQQQKNLAVETVHDAVGRLKDLRKLPREWLSALKLHSAVLPLAEFAAVIGNLRAARFGRTTAWRKMALFGALDELRHTQIPLRLMHEFVRWDKQFDWTHKFYHSNNWIAVAARHLTDELLLTANPLEFAIATNFVFETGFTNLQFVGLSALAEIVGDHLFEKMAQSIQTDEARHAQIGPAVLEILINYDKEYVQFLLDKWFWRSWLLFSITTGFSMDYFTPVEKRQYSFKEFMQEWIIEHYLQSLKKFNLKKPWYWDTFLTALEYYHHMVYVSAYTYRATTWFDWHLPSPKERDWLAQKYPTAWHEIAPIWEQLDACWSKSDVGVEWATHAATPVGFCNLCQLVLCNGTPSWNSAITLEYKEQQYIFCSEPCRTIFLQDVERYAGHRDIVKRILAGEAPPNVIELVTQYFGLSAKTWGKDIYQGNYPWLRRGSDDK